MKKLLTNITLSGLLILSLTACSSGDEQADTTTGTGTTTSTPEAGNTAEPTPGTSPAVDFTMYDEYSDLEPSIAYTFTSVRGMMGMGYVPNMPIDGEMQEQVFGVPQDLFTAFHGEVPMMNTQADQLLVYYTEENQAEIQEILETYVAEQLANQSQYPSTLEKLAVAEVFTSGNYVVLNMLSSYPENEASMEAGEMSAFFTETIAQVSAEIVRVLDGGEPNAPFTPDMSDLDSHPAEGEDFLGEFITPEGGEAQLPGDIDHLAPAVPPEDGQGGVEMPTVGEATAGHAPEAMTPNAMPEQEVAGGGSSRN